MKEIKIKRKDIILSENDIVLLADEHLITQDMDVYYKNQKISCAIRGLIISERSDFWKQINKIDKEN